MKDSINQRMSGNSLSDKPFVLIPSRMESTRFPGKPLALIAGKPMIHRVYDKVALAHNISGCAICTDSEKIIEYACKNGLSVIKTGNCHTGTDRVFEANKEINSNLIINVQGDEPLIDSEFIDRFSENLQASQNCTNTTSPLIMSSYCSATEEEALCKNVVKVFINSLNEAVSFSRFPICSAVNDGVRCIYKQIGIYGYNKIGLEIFQNLGYSQLEETEKVELMRWIDFVGPVKMTRSEFPAYSVDTIEDLIKVEQLIIHSANGKLS